MWDGFVGNTLRRINQRILVCAILILALASVFFTYKRAYFYGFFAGPHPVTAQQLLAARSPSSFANPFITITDEGGETTDLEQIQTENGRNTVSARFQSVLVGGRHMLVRVAPFSPPAGDASTPLPAAKLTGALKLTSDLRQDVYGSYAPANGDLLPVYLDAYNYRAAGYVALVIALPLLMIALWMLWRWLQVSSDLSRSTLCRKLAAQGQLEILLQQIDSEMAAPHLSLSRRALRADVSEHWLVVSHFMGAVAMQLPSIVWVHRSLVKRRIYFFITVSKRHLVNIYDQTGQKAAVQLAEAKAAELFGHLRSLTPRAIHGYDKRLPVLWRRTANKAGFPDAAAAMLGGQPLAEQRITNRYGG